MSSVYEFILQSLFSKKIHEVGGAQSGLGSSFTVPRMHVTTGRSQNQQGVCRRQRNRETQRVRETGVRARERERKGGKREGEREGGGKEEMREGGGEFQRPSASELVELVFILFPETVPCWEELPASFLIHLPDIRLLQKETYLQHVCP